MPVNTNQSAMLKPLNTVAVIGFILIVAAVLLFGAKVFTADRQVPEKFGFGKLASNRDLTKWDVDVRPDGKGLPAGEGNVVQGKAIYAAKCASCHAADGKEIPGIKLPGPPLVSTSLTRARPKTIGNYWPYATTLFDYTRRTMPYNLPGSLTDDEVYSLTAYLLYANQIIKAHVVMNAKTLPEVVMPARKLFVRDTRRGGNEVK